MLLLSRNLKTQRIRILKKVFHKKTGKVPFGNFPAIKSASCSGVHHETRTVLTELVGTVTRMSVRHEVTTARISHDLPVSITLNELTNGRHGCAEVLDTVLGASLAGIDAPTAIEMINDLTLLAKIAVAHTNYFLKLVCTPFVTIGNCELRFSPDHYVLIVANFTLLVNTYFEFSESRLLDSNL